MNIKDLVIRVIHPVSGDRLLFEKSLTTCNDSEKSAKDEEVNMGQDAADSNNGHLLGRNSLLLVANFRSLRLRTKILLTLLFLFGVVMLLGIAGGYFVQRIADNAIRRLHENYQIISYTREMSQSMNDMIWAITLEKSSPSYRRQQLRKASDNFETYLRLQLEKATGKEELFLTEQLRRDYEAFKQSLKGMQFTNEVPVEVYMKQLNIQGILQSVHDINAKAIQQRTEDARLLADRVTLYMIIFGFVFFILAVFAVLHFPGYIAEPVQHMTESMQQIARKNYSQRLPVHSDDEFGKMALAFNQMAEKLEEYENINLGRILSEKQRTETIVSRIREAIIGLDDGKNILFVNPPALALIGLRESDCIGRNAAELAVRLPVLSQILKEILQDEIRESITVPAVSIDFEGKKLYFNKDILKIESHFEEASAPMNMGFVVILKNITDLKEQDLAKTNFMATLSHELKTPISAIDMCLNLLENVRIGPLNEEQKELTRTIRQNSSRLLKMVNEILDISRIETGKLHLDQNWHSPHEILNRASESVSTFLVEKNIRLEQRIDERLPMLYIDSQKITAVLVNFLTNAIRYSPEGGTIDIQIRRQDEGIVFSVSDQGPGIPVEEQRKLFQPYRRAEGDKTKGTGLGLAIAKEFTKAHSGKIWVESQPGQGSKFSFWVPAKP